MQIRFDVTLESSRHDAEPTVVSSGTSSSTVQLIVHAILRPPDRHVLTQRE